MTSKINTMLLSVFISVLCLGGNSHAEGEAPRPMSAVDYLNQTPLAVEESKEVIADIINSNDLKGEKKTTQWKLKDLERDEPDYKMPEWMKLFSVIFATLFEYALWGGLLLAVILLYLSREHWLHLFSTEKVLEEEYQAPDILFGMDVRVSSLPDDLISEAQALWQQKKARAALSLLYRGALVSLINGDHIPLENSHTEGDILTLSQQSLAENKHHYLSQLTAQWQLIAYAHRIPMEEIMQWLFTHWQQDFADQTTSIRVSTETS
jgi:hypothetical protein